MQTEDAPELTPEFLEDLRRYTEYGWGPGITAALLNRWHPVALTNLDVIRLRRRLGRAAAPVQNASADETKAAITTVSNTTRRRLRLRSTARDWTV